MPPRSLPFNRPSLLGKELDYIRQAFDQGMSAGDGPFSRKCQNMLEEVLGVTKALLTTSCTHALEMAALLLDIRESDEVIVPSFTFVSTINAFVLRGAKPIFADVRPDTLNLNEAHLERLITPRTRAIVPMHYGGVGCEMDAIMAISRQHRVPVVEDNAHGLFARYKGKYLGTFGSLATQSFHETKNLICGEGGALLINDPELIERAEIIRERGTDRSQFFRGQVDKYTWRDIGSSYVLSDILAAFLLAQMEQRERIQARRCEIWDLYRKGLKGWAEKHDVGLSNPPSYAEHSSHVFYLVLPELGDQNLFLAHMKAAGIHCVFHYLPLHLSPMGQKYGGMPGDCPVTESVAARLVRLPLYFDLSPHDQSRIISRVVEFSFKSSNLRNAD